MRCQVRSISGFSAHADETELLDWLRAVRRRAGDPAIPAIRAGSSSSTATRTPRSPLEPKVQALGFATHVPHWHERVELT